MTETLIKVEQRLANQLVVLGSLQQTKGQVNVSSTLVKAAHGCLDVAQALLDAAERVAEHVPLRLNVVHRERLVVLEAREALHDGAVNRLAWLRLLDWRQDRRARLVPRWPRGSLERPGGNDRHDGRCGRCGRARGGDGVDGRRDRRGRSVG